MSLDLNQIFSHGLIEKLISQSARHHDRDANEAWMKYDNFGEFFAFNKPKFIVQYSTTDLLAARILQFYVMEQLAGFLERNESTIDGGWDRVNDAVRSAIHSDMERLLALLRGKWSAEYAAIEVLNSSAATVR